MPKEKEDKVAFLERWIAAVIQKLEGQEVQLDQVCPVNIVSGADPEWTGYLLQCTAVAAWSGKPADPEDGAAEAAPEAETAAPAEEEAPRPTTAAPRLSAEEIAQREAELAQREAEATAAAAAAVAAAEAAANAPDVLAPLEVPVYESPQFDEEKLKEMADGMDFAQAMAAFTGVVGPGRPSHESVALHAGLGWCALSVANHATLSKQSLRCILCTRHGGEHAGLRQALGSRACSILHLARCKMRFASRTASPWLLRT